MSNKLLQKAFFSIIFLLIILSGLAAQPGWEIRYGEEEKDNFPERTIVMPDGFIYTAGYTDYPEFFFIAKVSGAGMLQWYHDLGQVFVDENPIHFDTLSNGNFILIGRAGSSWTNYELKWLEISQQGNVVKEVVVPLDASWSIPNRIALAPEDKIVAAGRLENDENAFFFIQCDLSGNVLIEKEYDPLGGGNSRLEFWNTFRDYRVKLTEDGGFLFGAVHEISDFHQWPTLIKLDSTGSLAWYKEMAYCHSSDSEGLQLLEGGDILFRVNKRFTDDSTTQVITYSTDPRLYRLSSAGDSLWDIDVYSSAFFPFIVSDQGDLLESYSRTVSGQVRLYKKWHAPDGILKSSAYYTFQGVDYLGYPQLIRTSDEGWLFSATTDNLNADTYVAKFNSNDEIEFELTTNLLGNERFYYLQELENQTYLCTGYFLEASPAAQNELDVYQVRLDSAGNYLYQGVRGNVFRDIDADCSKDSLEAPMPDVVVKVNDGLPRYTLPDSLGNYGLAVSGPAVTVTPYSYSPYWLPCEGSVTDTFPVGQDTLYIDLPIAPVVDCPFLEFDIGTHILRVCRENTYVISYCNTGTVTAEDSYVVLELDPNLSVLSADVPYTDLGGNTFQFEIGDVDVFECGKIRVTTEVACDENLLGYNLCVTAHVFPDTLCMDSIPSFDGAWIVANAVCQDTAVEFSLKNIGNAATPPGLSFIIIEDAVLLMEMPIDLEGGEVKTEKVTADGSTYNLVADQAPGVPGPDKIGAGAEGCNTFGGDLSLGLLNDFTLFGGDPFTKRDCREVFNSCDPNDKLAFPQGYGPERFIWKNQELNYLIRFQNTGNDTAFKVVLLDTLSDYLDPSTIRIGASSHNNVFDMYTNDAGQQVLRFTFDDILLPDSTTNEPASHGFVKFRISPVADIPLGAVIQNRAAIYFDFNKPVITNYVWHTIGENFIEIDEGNETAVNEPEHSSLKVTVSPNPFSEEAVFQLQNVEEHSEGLFQLYASSGQMVRSEPFSGSQYLFQRESLPSGIYFFTLQYSSGNRISGRVFIR